MDNNRPYMTYIRTCSSQSSSPCSHQLRSQQPGRRGPDLSESRSEGRTHHCGTTAMRTKEELHNTEIIMPAFNFC